MPTTTWRALPRSRVWLVLLLAGCAQPPERAPAPAPAQPPPAPVELSALPATYVDDPACPGCLAVTLTLRPDGSFLRRDQLGASEFYDFGRWRQVDGALELAGEREARRLPLHSLRRSARVEALRGPFRMVGLYDGTTFTECRTKLKWPLSATRAAENLKEDFQKKQPRPALVALDAQFEGSPETLRVLRPATILDKNACS
jgi:hypothetical protein